MKIKNSITLLLIISLLAVRCSKEKTTDPLKDIDGNVYKTVTIGTQVWMQDNLRTTRLNDGTDITLVKDASAWNDLTSQGYCWYNNDEVSFKETYGALYNGYTVLTGKICPTDWHVPSKEEWETLIAFVYEPLKAGGKLKESGTDHWLSPNTGGTNSSGFSALPAGLRYFEGTFASIGTFTGFWSSDESESEGYYAGLYHTSSDIVIDHRNTRHGFSIRCLKN
jgi:uncharacterized protein (TIGR02145 family)